jgi:tyrosyl-tRNA synthetase
MNNNNLIRGINIADVFPSTNLQEFLKTPRVIKLGFDPTADFLHLGHAVLLNKLKQFQECGHIPKVIIGDFTATIGDPSGKSSMRKQLSQEEVNQNIDNFLTTLEKFIDIERYGVVYNSQHLKTLGLTDIIHLQSLITVNQILAKKDFQQRFENQTPIGLHEFMYPILQGYDSFIVESEVELGGIDQKFNVSMGRDIQRLLNSSQQQIGVLMPILVGTDGVHKMSKSLNNCIKIDEHPLIMYSQLEKIPDGSVDDYITLLTDRDLNDFSKNPRDRQKQMALEVVSVFHGKDIALQAQRESEQIILSNKTIKNVPEIEISFLKFPIQLACLLRDINLFESSSSARRAIRSGSVKIDGVKVTDENLIVNLDDVVNKVIQTSKKEFHRLNK